MSITNKEFFGDVSLNSALAKYEEDVGHGLSLPFWDWLDSTYMDLSMGKLVRGVFYSYGEIEDKIRRMESMSVTGYLLEWKDEKTGAWFGSEFEPELGSGTNKHDVGRDVVDDWFDNDVEVGFFRDLGDTWLGTADDWGYRLGVDFDCAKTPTETPSEDNVWVGTATGECRNDGAPWRVRKVTIKGELSDKAKEFIRRNPDVWFAYAEKA